MLGTALAQPRGVWMPATPPPGPTCGPGPSLSDAPNLGDITAEGSLAGSSTSPWNAVATLPRPLRISVPSNAGRRRCEPTTLNFWQRTRRPFTFARPASHRRGPPRAEARGTLPPPAGAAHAGAGRRRSRGRHRVDAGPPRVRLRRGSRWHCRRRTAGATKRRGAVSRWPRAPPRRCSAAPWALLCSTKQKPAKSFF